VCLCEITKLAKKARNGRRKVRNWFQALAFKWVNLYSYNSEGREENSAWKETKKAGDSSNSNDGAREACLAAVAKYDMPRDVAAVAERCERFFDIGGRL
jgi:hypothetical protein